MSLVEMLKGKQHVIWDWNGTLLNDIDHSVDTVNHLLQSQSLPPVTIDSYKKEFEFPVINYYRRLGFDFSKEPFEALCDRFVSRYMERFMHCDLVEGMREVLESLRQHVDIQSILSASDQDSLNHVVRHFDLTHLFDHVVGIKNKFAASKVERGQELIERAGIERQQTVIIGDTLHDLEVGEHLGIDVVLVAHGHHCPDRLRQKHHAVINIQKAGAVVN